MERRFERETRRITSQTARSRFRYGPVVTAVLLLATTFGDGANAPAEERKEPAPNELARVGIIEHLNERIPLDLQFIDSDGKTIRLGDCFKTGRPVILNLIYYGCPMLCSLVMNGMIDGLKDVPLTVGKDFDIVTVSINPRETPTLARLNKQNHVKAYGRGEAAGGWHFLTGREENIKKLADKVGFGYEYVEARQEYAHAAGIFILTPDGRLSRYLYGIQYDASTLRLALVEAGEGKIGSTVDRILLFCFHYDARAGKYNVAAFRIMQAGGLITLLVLGTILGLYWRRESRRRRTQADAAAGSATES